MRPGFLSLPDGRIETAWWGPGPAEAATIVLLHEGLGCVALWRDVPERLAEATGLGVFAYSRFGYGQSDPVMLPRPMTYMHHEGQVVLPQVLAAAGIRDAVLVGHSDGGSIAAIYAGMVGEASVVACETDCAKTQADIGAVESNSASRPLLSRHHPDCPGHPLGGGEAWVAGTSQAVTIGRGMHGHDGWHNVGHENRHVPHLHALITIAAHFFVEDLNIASIRQIRDTYLTGDLRPRLARYHRDPDIAFQGWNGAWLDPRFRDFDITGFLPSIHVPTLGLQGADDPYGTNEQLHVMRSHLTAPIQTRLIRNARHAPHLEAKDATIDAIAHFIAANVRQFIS